MQSNSQMAYVNSIKIAAFNDSDISFANWMFFPEEENEEEDEVETK